METLYPDVIGSGGAPKRIMKPKRRDGQPGDESELGGINSSILSAEQTVSSQPSGLESPGAQPAANPVATGSSSSSSGQLGSVTPSAVVSSAAAQSSALTPPEDTTTVSRKRALELDASSLSASDTPSRLEQPQVGSPEKRLRFSTSDDGELASTAAAPLGSASPPPMAVTTATRQSADAESSYTPAAYKPRDPTPLGTPAPWCERAVDLFYRDFSLEDLDLQVKIPHDLLSQEHTAMVFCKMPAIVREHWVRSLRHTLRK